MATLSEPLPGEQGLRSKEIAGDHDNHQHRHQNRSAIAICGDHGFGIHVRYFLGRNAGRDSFSIARSSRQSWLDALLLHQGPSQTLEAPGVVVKGPSTGRDEPSIRPSALDLHL